MKRPINSGITLPKLKVDKTIRDFVFQKYPFYLIFRNDIVDRILNKFAISKKNISPFPDYKSKIEDTQNQTISATR